MPEKISLHEDCVLIFDSHDFAVFFDIREHGDPSIDAAVLIAGQRCFQGTKSLGKGDQCIVFDGVILEHGNTIRINGHVNGLKLMIG